jgi:uridine kinase
LNPFIVAINAVSGGGKTTITNEIQKCMPNTKALFFDDRNYDSDSGIEDTCKWIEEGADANLFNLERLVNDINDLSKEAIDFIILDYPFGYKHNQIRPYLDYSIYIDTPLDIAHARRILRDHSQENASAILDDMKQYLERGRGAYLFGLEDTRQSADFVIDGSLPLDTIVGIICKKIVKEKSDRTIDKHFLHK